MSAGESRSEVVIIAAMAANRVIGRDGGLPWHLPGDLRRFREVTMGHAVLMGRRTMDSLGRPLPGRRNLVLSRDPRWRAPGCETFTSLDAALKACAGEKVHVIGGAQIFALALPLARRVILTVLDREVEGDTFFPPLPHGFRLVATEAVREGEPFVIRTYARK